jgi:NAD(P)-dependent dehydrogenase (short-subunit alcohol dehydrogenase family)
MLHVCFHVAGGPAETADALATLLAIQPPPVVVLVNADADPDPPEVFARSRRFADTIPAGEEALIVTLLNQTDGGLPALPRYAAAALWAFTRQAALDWAPRRIRVNAIGLGCSPAGPFETTGAAFGAAASVPAKPASLADIARTLRTMAGLPSMTGQIIRLGA